MRHTSVRSALVIVLAAGVAACGSPAAAPAGGAAASTPAGGVASGPAGVATSTARSSPSAAPDLASPEEMARGIDVPWGLAFLPGGEALIAERDTGRVLRLAPGGRPALMRQVAGVDSGGEGGLLGLAVSPGFATDNLVYAYLTAANDNRVVRFRLDGGGQEVVFDGIAKASFHNGGRIAFGPDGMLYVGTGDAGNTASSQDPASPNGKILRITPDGDPAPGNPAADSPVYSLGHRNVQGLDWDPEGRLFATEFGQNDLDEVNLIRAGANYGWPQVEGEGGTQGGRFTNPLVTWPVREASPSGMAITAGTVYVAGLRGERLWTAPLDGDRLGTPTARLTGAYGRLRTVEVAPDGALWLTTSNTDGRGDVRDGDDRLLRFPAR
ncbi:PQQ-dependent sugar dehydrogenase [Actinoplanes sp. NEAU-A12]|uniref:PQQ-dependent sugar dehydrogenase n=1 Tax=Actinoplanes sandaracinus TaxID=3045177 RepID=A0ABT6WGL2_9ACTN|nr:PQQ-dependent sugar dehydrogenase [Actinoplanes sandaracinus]MDI6098861.1 PQQ-dependent sugar dehydrogenase [Actinoplanes sandaracinus]